MFNNLGTDGLEESQDRLGGFQTFNTDIYTGVIKAAYAGESAKGAMSISFIIAMPGGREYKETVYVTNKKKENFFMQDKKKIPLPGFTVVDDICLIATGKPLAEQETEEKVIKIYNYDSKKDEPTAVQMLVGLLDQPIKVGIQKTLENKKEKSGDDYVDVAGEREVNNIEKVFHPEMNLTVAEARSGQDAAAFHDAWLERNKDKVRDKRTIKDGQAGNTGAPPKPGANQTAAAPRTSLFNKG